MAAEQGKVNEEGSLEKKGTLDGARDAIAKNKNKIDTLKKDFKKKLSVLTVICNILPSLGIIDAAKQLVKEAIADVIRFLLELLLGIFGKTIEWLRKNLSKFLAIEVKNFSTSIGLKLDENFKSCFLCKINPTIPDWLVDDGFSVEINSFDFKDMFKIRPDSPGGQMLYGGNEDLNRFLHDVIQSGGEEKQWTYNNVPIARFKFIERGANVGYDSTNDRGESNNRGKQNTDRRNNVINIKLDEKYRGRSIISFVKDYVKSATPIFYYKKAMTSIISNGYGTIPRISNLSIESIRKQVLFDYSLTKMVNESIDNEEFEIDNTFFTFTDAELAEMNKQVDEQYNGIKELPSCCCGESSISNSSIISFNQRINKTTTLEGDIDVVTNTLNQITEESTIIYPKDQKAKGVIDFYVNILSNLSTILTSMILSPKINFMIVMLHYMTTKTARFENAPNFITVAKCMVSNILNDVLKKLLYNLLIPSIMSSLFNLLKCAMKEVVRKKIEDDIVTWASLNPFNSSKNVLAKTLLINELRNFSAGGVDLLENKANDILNNNS